MPDGHILAVDRSAKAIAQPRAASHELMESGRMRLRQVAAEDGRLFVDGGDPLREVTL